MLWVYSNNMSKQFNTEPDPYFNGHAIGIEDKFKEKDSDLEYQRLCYEAFLSNKDGLALLEQFKTRYHCMPLFTPMHPNAEKLALFFEGFKEAFRGLEHAAKTHQKRILEHKG